MDRVRFVKLMEMTASDNDGEALNALRMANKMMAAEKLRWGDVLQQERSTTINVVMRPRTEDGLQESGDWVAPHLKDTHVIELMFRTVYATPMNDGFRQFIDSLHQWWLQHKQLTQRQYNALRQAYTRARA